MISSKNIIFYIFVTILSLSKCAPPPKIEKMEKIIPDPPIIYSDKKKFLFFPMTYGAGQSYLEETLSNMTTTFYPDYRIIEHVLTITAKNLEDGYYYKSWSFTTNTAGLTIEENYCQVFVKGKPTTRDCNADSTPNEETERTKLIYNFKIYNNEQVVITYRFKRAKSKQILYIKESVSVPLFSDTVYCDYKFIIPKGVISLGLKNNLLMKVSDTLYTFKGICPTDDENDNDVIRYSPETVLWKTIMKIYLEHPPRFTNNVDFVFPLYYKGGKLRNTYYHLFSSNGHWYNPDHSINQDQKFELEVPAANYDKVGVEMHTGFSNKLTDEFKVYLPEYFYDIDYSKIDDEIKAKTNEIISKTSDKPNYYKIGEFVHNHITYTNSYTGKELTPKEIYYGKKGVCQHYVLLYNAMLNSIGIKTLYVSGWALDGEQTSGNSTTTLHAWTAALIDGKWKELDPTWGLFEGVTAGHIFKNFGSDVYSYRWYEVKKPGTNFYRERTIEMVSDPDEIKDPYSQDTEPVITDKGNGGGDSIIIPNKSFYQRFSLVLLILAVLAL